MKLCTRDYFGKITTKQILVPIGAVGAPPQMSEIVLPLCDYFDCPALTLFSRSCTQVEPLDRLSRFMAQINALPCKVVPLG